MGALSLNAEIYGPLWPLIRRDTVTDINFNGRDLWVDDVIAGRYLAAGIEISEQFVKQFSMYLANQMNRSFNQYEPCLEAETEDLRISLIHESVAHTGRSLSIRKTPGVRRLHREGMEDSGYSPCVLNTFMANCVKAGLTIVIAGLPGVGKTEYLKYLTDYIPAKEKVITVEDNLEIRYRRMNPERDGIELKVGPTFSYEQAIKASMRQLPKWLILSEARSREITYLLEAMSTGVRCMTTIHTDDVRKIPDRICNMMKADVANDVYTFVDIGVLIGCYHIPGKGIQRRIEQVAILDRTKEQNTIKILYEDGVFHHLELSPAFQRKFSFAGIPDPYEEGAV